MLGSLAAGFALARPVAASSLNTPTAGLIKRLCLDFRWAIARIPALNRAMPGLAGASRWCWWSRRSFGVHAPHPRMVCRARLAQQGYLAIAPSLF